MTVDRIECRDLMPLVFKGMENSEDIRHSQVWKVSALLLERGCKVCVHAQSGRGKSSLLSFIYGERSDYEGTIAYDGQDIRRFGISKWCSLRKAHIALLPQEMRLFADLTVMQNIRVKNSLTSHKTQGEIEDLLGRLGIAGKINEPVRRLSIGQQQRVAIIRTLCQPFDFLLLDEPVSHLDSANNRIVADIIQEEAARQGAGIVATSVGNHLMLDDAEIIKL